MECDAAGGTTEETPLKLYSDYKGDPCGASMTQALLALKALKG